MNSEDISRFIHGCEVLDFKGSDLKGHVGIMIMHSYLSKPNFDLDRFIKDNKLEREMCISVSDSFEQNGFYCKYNWPWRSRTSLLSALKHKSKATVRDWCHIAGVASGYVGK
jgi:hypothetical protein